MIDVWIKREVRFNKGGDDSELHEKLYEFSINFALELFKNREQSTNMRMPKDCYKQFIKKNGYTDYNFSGRSLMIFLSVFNLLRMNGEVTIREATPSDSMIIATAVCSMVAPA